MKTDNVRPGVYSRHTNAMVPYSQPATEIEGLQLCALDERNAVLLVGALSDLGSLYAGIANLIHWAEQNTFADEINLECRIRLDSQNTFSRRPQIARVIFNNPATIVYWTDGSKTVVKCQAGDTFDREKGLMAAFMKKALGNKNEFNKVIKKWVTE